MADGETHEWAVGQWTGVDQFYAPFQFKTKEKADAAAKSTEKQFAQTLVVEHVPTMLEHGVVFVDGHTFSQQIDQDF